MKKSAQVVLLLVLALTLRQVTLAAGVVAAPDGTCATPDDYASYCLAAHNIWRPLHHAPHLRHSQSLSEQATRWARHLADIEVLEHSQSGHGENLAWSSVANMDCLALVGAWYEEVQHYDYGRPGFSRATGHFTQLVWRDTEWVGCGRARATGGRKGGVYLVCNYSPPGNVVGGNLFGQNVRSPRWPPDARRSHDSARPAHIQRTLFNGTDYEQQPLGRWWTEAAL